MSPETPQRIKHPAKSKGRFAVPMLDVALGSASAKTRAGAHVVGRPFTNYLALPFGSAKVDAVADRLTDNAVDKDDLRITLRSAVLSAHSAGARKITEFNARYRTNRAAAALRALRALSELVYDPSFIPAIWFAAPIVAAEHPSYGDQVHALARALDSVSLLDAVVTDELRRLKPVEQQNPGRPYMAGFAESLVAFWHKQTGEFPSKTRKSAIRSKSRRVLFWDFSDRALADLFLQDQPIGHHVRSAIDRQQKGVRAPLK